MDKEKKAVKSSHWTAGPFGLVCRVACFAVVWILGKYLTSLQFPSPAHAFYILMIWHIVGFFTYHFLTFCRAINMGTLWECIAFICVAVTMCTWTLALACLCWKMTDCKQYKTGVHVF